MIYLKISTVCLSIVLVVGQSNYPPNNYNPQNNYDSQTYNPNYPQNSNNNNYNPQNNNYNPQSSFPQSNYNNPNNPNNQNNYNNPNNQNNYNNPNNPNYNQNNYNQNNYNNPQIDQGDCCEEYCYSDDPEPYSQFGTKTSYDSLTRRGGNQHVIPDCKPVQFWSIVRHGTNLPDQETIRMMREKSRLHEDIIRNHEQRRSWPDKGRLCAKDYDLFKRWRFNESISERNANSLTKQGSDDMKLIARRYKTRFSELLQNYDERTYNFQYTPENHDSFQAYIEGLFENDAFRVHANTINGDRLTRPTQFCPRWQELESSQFITASEIQRFKDKPEYQKMVKDVFRRLGYRFAPNATVIEEIYNLCRYEKAWNPLPKSAWCIAFNQNQLKVLEYAEDLKYYYESGYGNKLADRIGCNPVKDMYERFERTVNGNPDGTKASFLFSNTDTFISTLVSLGIAKEGPLLNSENYYQQTRRDWRTSVLSPFAANLVATLYECNRDEKYRVMFFLNENPVEFRECSVGLCNWSAVQQKYQETVRDCDINNFCKKGGAAKNFAASAVFLLTSLLIFKL